MPGLKGSEIIFILTEKNTFYHVLKNLFIKPKHLIKHIFFTTYLKYVIDAYA